MNSGVMKSTPEGNRFTGNIVVGGQVDDVSLNADKPNNGLDHDVFLRPGALDWWRVVPRDMLRSTTPGTPCSTPAACRAALVDGQGLTRPRPALRRRPSLKKDAAGACAQ